MPVRTNAISPDLRGALRSLRRSPLFVAAVVVSLSLGVGLNGVMFAFVDAAILRPPPYVQADRLLTVQDSRRVPDEYLLSLDEFDAMRRTATHVQAIAAYRAGGAYRYALTLDEGPPKALGIAVSASAFDVLGVRPIIGRTIRPSDERADASPVVVLGGGLWRRAFGADRSILGKRVRIRQRSYTVIGVMPDAFWFPDWDVEFWTPLSPITGGFSASDRSLSLIARVGPHDSRREAVAELEGLGQRLDASLQKRERRWWRIDPLADALRPGDLQLVVILQLVAAAILLLACVNVSNLMVVRVGNKRRDFAIRTALGASRWRTARPIVYETLFLSAGAGILGGGVALAAMRVLLATFDRRGLANWIGGGATHVLGFAIVSGLLTMALCAPAPLLQLVRRKSVNLAEGGSRSGLGSSAKRTLRVAVVAQIALSLALCANALLLTRSLLDAARWSPSFPVDGLVSMRLAARSGSHQPPVHVRDLEQRLLSIRGVRQVGVSQGFNPDGPLTADAGGEAPACSCEYVSPGFMETLGIPIRSGRRFDASDVATGQSAVVDERLARTLWGTASVVGRRVRIGSDGPWATVVGVIPATDLARPPSDPRLRPPPSLWVAAAADSLTGGAVFIRGASSASPAALTASIRDAALELGLTEQASSVTSVAASLTRALDPMRRYIGIFSALSVLGLVLTLVGMNGMIAHHVSAHTREFGIRAALGASPGALSRAVVRDAGTLTALGLVVGAIVAAATARLVATVVLDTAGGPVIPVLIAVIVLLAACAAAVLPPAWRAGRASPMEAIRE
ncbi:MAG TPA: ABC transporter permease [Gemmatimonadaceae bacterium]|nr:ABC transporter permease [Gemmatimonadaceae bacterium]